MQRNPEKKKKEEPKKAKKIKKKTRKTKRKSGEKPNPGPSTKGTTPSKVPTSHRNQGGGGGLEKGGTAQLKKPSKHPTKMKKKSARISRAREKRESKRFGKKLGGTPQKNQAFGDTRPIAPAAKKHHNKGNPRKETTKKGARHQKRP